ncbi:MAG: polysaccharide lyase family protein, partial [Armatimonadota bacterium]
MSHRSSALVLVASLSSLAAPAASAAPDVSLHDDGTRAWLLGNGLIELRIDRAGHYLAELRLADGRELLAGNGGYCDLSFSRDPAGDRRSTYTRLGTHFPVRTRVCAQTPAHVDVAVTTDGTLLDPSQRMHPPLLLDLHYVLRRGEPGFYVYLVVRHPAELPRIRVHQIRYILRCDPHLLDSWRLTDDRVGQFVPPDIVARSDEIANATFRTPAGEVFTKYFLSMPIEDSPVYGLWGRESGLGLWLIYPAREFINGGPTKQNLTLHEVPGTTCLLADFHSAHYAGPSSVLDLASAWTKIYGPVFFYVNTSQSSDDLWARAKARARREAQRWPHAWLRDAGIAAPWAPRRGTVRGRVAIEGATSPKGALVVLGDPSPHWQSQGKGHLFWARARADGRFSIPKVRPGAYMLYAVQKGIYGEARLSDVLARAGRQTNVGTVTLSPIRHGQTLWQIGTPDRTAAEFRHGDDYRHFGLMNDYDAEFPEGVRFEIGRSTERTDWNYCQPGPRPDGSLRPWRVLFDCAEQLRGTALLALAIADSSYHPPATVEVAVNHTVAGEMALEPGDSAAPRSGIYGHYQVAEL